MAVGAKHGPGLKTKGTAISSQQRRTATTARTAPKPVIEEDLEPLITMGSARFDRVDDWEGLASMTEPDGHHSDLPYDLYAMAEEYSFVR